MAIIKEVTIGGVTAEYWTLETMDKNPKDESLCLKMALYVDKAAYQASPGSPVMRKSFYFSNMLIDQSDYPLLETLTDAEDSNDTVVAYAALMQLSYFSGATEDLDEGQDPYQITFPGELEFF